MMLITIVYYHDGHDDASWEGGDRSKQVILFLFAQFLQRERLSFVRKKLFKDFIV